MIEIEEKSKWISREKTRLEQLSEDIEKAKSALEARTTKIVVWRSCMDVDATELKDLERRAATYVGNPTLSSFACLETDIQASIEAKRRRSG